MPKISEESLEERRAAITAAAMRVFAKKGLSRVTLRDIFREAGMSAGAVYNYFRSKDEIILAVTEAGIGEALAALELGENAGNSLESVIDYFFGALQQSSGAPQHRVDVMIVAEALANPDVHRAVAKNRAAIKAALRRLVERKQETDAGWRARSASDLAELLYTTYQGLVMSLALGEKVDVKAVGAALAAMKFE